jgi:hypothetical protein
MQERLFPEPHVGRCRKSPHPRPLPIGWGEGEEHWMQVEGPKACAKQRKAFHEPYRCRSASERCCGWSPTQPRSVVHGPNACENANRDSP